MSRLPIALSLALLTALPLHAQTTSQTTQAQTTSQTTQFEVATVRIAPTTAIAADGHWTPPSIGRFNASSVTLGLLIHLAYGVDEDQITGKPAWFGSQLYDVTAKPEAGVKLSRDELKPRLQALLAERFHLLTHRETRPGDGYILVVAKGGPKLQPTIGDHFPGFRADTSSGKLEGFNWSMPFLAGMLQRPAGRPVVDKTGLTGSYDLKLAYAPDVDTESTLPSLFTALRESLGLELKPEKVPVEFLVIDQVDRIPAEN